MIKCAIIKQYLEDHAKIICNQLNFRDPKDSWRAHPIPDQMRRNIKEHYGWTHLTLKDINFNIADSPDTFKLHSPPLAKPIQLKPNVHQKKAKIRMSLKRLVKLEGIFSKGIKAESKRRHKPRPSSTKQSTSPIYATDSDDWLQELFNEPDDLDEASFHHNCSLNTHWATRNYHSLPLDSFSAEKQPSAQPASLGQHPNQRPFSKPGPFSQPSFIH